MKDIYAGVNEMFADIADPIERARLIKNERNRRWKRANRDKVRAARKRYCEKYPEKIKQENKRFRENNPDYKKEYYETHREEAKEWLDVIINGLDYKDLPVLCKVSDKAENGKKMVNTAEITKYEDGIK